MERATERGALVFGPRAGEVPQSLRLCGAPAYFTFAAEVIGVALISLLLGATWAHSGNGWVFTSTHGGSEYPAFLAAAALAHVLIGDGAYAMTSSFRARKLRPAVIPPLS